MIDIELICVDDDSTVGSHKILPELQTKWRRRSLRVELVTALGRDSYCIADIRLVPLADAYSAPAVAASIASISAPKSLPSIPAFL